MSEGRERWPSRSAFIMAAIGSAVGLGNVWRFPYRAFEGGGGAFLVPYFIALLTAGIPVMILEYGLGQWTQSASPRAFRSVGRRFEFLGWWPIAMCLMVAGYYCVIMAWCWNYLWYSFSRAWGEDTKAFFESDFLHEEKLTSSLAMGGFNWHVLIPLAVTWLLIYWIIVKGLGRVGKVVMWSVPLPVLCLLILFFRGVTLDGAIQGIIYFLKPNFGVLFGPDAGKIWMLAYAQVFFSLSVGWGILITYSSYRPRKSDVTNNAIITSLANCGVSFFAGLVVFSIVGHMAFVEVGDAGAITEKALQKAGGGGGSGLAFVAYPRAINAMESLPGGAILASVFGIIFFVMLLTLGIDSAFSMIEAALGGIFDKFYLPRRRVCAIACLLGFGMGCVYLTRVGRSWLDIVDNWVTYYGITVIALLECIVIGWLWKGKSEFKKYINSVSEIKIGIWWDICIMVITPGILITSLILETTSILKKGYGGYPPVAINIAGWGMAGACFLLAVVFMLMRGSRERNAESEVEHDAIPEPPVHLKSRSVWTGRNVFVVGMTLLLLFWLSQWDVMPYDAWIMLYVGVGILYVGLFFALRRAMQTSKKKLDDANLSG